MGGRCSPARRDLDCPIWPDDQGPNRWVLMVPYVHHSDTHRAHVGTTLGAAGAEPPSLAGWAFGALDPTAGPTGKWADGLLLRFFDHAGWAAHAVLEHCLGLGDPALRATAEGTYGTAQETLTHMVDGRTRVTLGAEPPITGRERV